MSVAYTPHTSNDKLYLYASLFLYNPKARAEYQTYLPSVAQFECKSYQKLKDMF